MTLNLAYLFLINSEPEDRTVYRMVDTIRLIEVVSINLEPGVSLGDFSSEKLDRLDSEQPLTFGRQVLTNDTVIYFFGLHSPKHLQVLLQENAHLQKVPKACIISVDFRIYENPLQTTHISNIKSTITELYNFSKRPALTIAVTIDENTLWNTKITSQLREALQLEDSIKIIPHHMTEATIWNVILELFKGQQDYKFDIVQKILEYKKSL